MKKYSCYFIFTSYLYLTKPFLIRMNISLFSILRPILLLCMGLLYPVLSTSADWNNFIINYNKSLYGKGSQTWQINAYDETWIYFANQSGILQYDGNSWSVFPLSSRFIRAVASKG